MPSIGGGERKIAESGPAGIIGGTVRWSPDGKWLLVSGTMENDERVGLLLIDFGTGEKRRLTSAPAPMSDRGGSFSPDGRQIGFLRQHSGNLQGDIYLLNIDAGFGPIGEARRLETGGLQAGPPAWTIDGKELVFRSSRAGRAGLWRIHVAGGPPVRIPVARNDVREPAIHGTRLAYVQQVSDRKHLGDPDVRDGRSATARCFDPRRWSSAIFAGWQPNRLLFGTERKPGDLGRPQRADGRRFAYAQQDRAGSDIVVVEGFR